MIIVLMGYMGSGKSTIGKMLATALDFNFIDLDDYLSRQENSTIPNLFKLKGEIYFRKKESQYLREILTSKDNIVLALGGGTPCYGNNMDLILESDLTKSFYLKIQIPILVERLSKEKESRPLISHLQSKTELAEFIGKHLFERSLHYSRADYSITIDSFSEKETLEHILLKLI